MIKLNFIAVLGLIFAGHVMAAEWEPIKQGEDTVREIDMSSIEKKGAVLTFIARHTFAGKSEFKVGRREVKYLLITSRVNCGARTLAQLATEAYDEKMALISKQNIQQSQDNPVTPGSIDEGALNHVCVNGGKSQN